MFPGVSFGSHNSPDFLAGIAGVEVVEQIAKRGEIIVPFIAVHSVIDGNIPNVTFRKETFGIVADFQIVPSHAGHIFDDDGFDFSGLGQPDHFIPARPIKRHPGHSIINEKCRIGKTIIGCILQKDFLLISNAVALAVQRILLGQAGV